MPGSGHSSGRAARAAAPPISPRVNGAASKIDAACRQAIDGKLAVRDLAAWAGAIGISEIELRVLWLLARRSEMQAAEPLPAPDQAELADRLAVSAAQVCVVVEKLRDSGAIEHAPSTSDRRRNAWQITAVGRQWIEGVIAVVQAGEIIGQSMTKPRRSGREVA